MRQRDEAPCGRHRREPPVRKNAAVQARRATDRPRVMSPVSGLSARCDRRACCSPRALSPGGGQPRRRRRHGPAARVSGTSMVIASRSSDLTWYPRTDRHAAPPCQMRSVDGAGVDWRHVGRMRRDRGGADLSMRSSDSILHDPPPDGVGDLPHPPNPNRRCPAMIGQTATAMTSAVAGRPRVTPGNHLSDIDRLVDLAGRWSTALALARPRSSRTTSLALPFPGANTTRWQLEGTSKASDRRGITGIRCAGQNNDARHQRLHGAKLKSLRPDLRDSIRWPVLYNFRTRP